MASTQDFAEYVLDQLGERDFSVKKMFGEYALYCEGKVVGFICDNTLFVKPTQASELELYDREKAPPYPGAKDYFVITEDDLEEKKFLINVLFKAAEDVVVKGKKSKLK